MPDWGIKISQEGNDVKDCGDHLLIFSSAFNTLKEYMRGTVSASVAAGARTEKTVAHGLGYAPSYIVFNDGKDGYYHPCNNGGLQRFIDIDYCTTFAWSDATNLNISLKNNLGTTKTITAYYYIFKDEV